MSLLELNSRNNGAESDAALHINNLDNISRGNEINDWLIIRFQVEILYFGTVKSCYSDCLV